MPDTSGNINDSLPPEVLGLIFSQLSKYENRTCMFVCTTWYVSAKKIFYAHTDLKDEHVTKRFLSCSKESDIGSYIQHLKISDSPKKGRSTIPSLCDQNEISALFDKCINLLVLEINGMNPYYVLRSLVSNEDKLKRLEEISIVWHTCSKISPAVKRAYFLANLVHKDTIRRIRFPNNTLNRYWPGKISKAAYFSLFPQLKEHSFEELTALDYFLSKFTILQV